MLQHLNYFKYLKIIVLIAIFSSLLFLIGCEPKTDNMEETNKEFAPHIMAASQVEAGRYLAIVGGCNDCHTEGYLQANGKIPEEDWLTGSSLGWQGPWGTTYPNNLRLSVRDYTVDDWVMILHEREDLPPMPWMNVNKMSERDARAIYEYIKSLDVKGDYAPEALRPGEEPKTPYISLAPQNLPEN